MQPTVGGDVAGQRVLVVEDNGTTCGILGEVLREWTATPTLVLTLDDAVSAAREAENRGTPFDVLLLDGGLGGTSGVNRLRTEANLRCPAVLLMTTTARRPDAERCEALGILEFVTKPVRPVHLLSAMVDARRTSSPDVRLASASMFPTRRRRSPLDVLLAEDNAVNQMLAVRLLEKEGHRVTVVGTGREALDTIARAAFDLVLMDVQMPEMDGLEAVAILRKQELREGSPRLPVIAMTAFTMKGDRERFMESGFDGYIRKPISIRELLDAIDALAPPDTEAKVVVPPPPTAPRGVGIPQAFGPFDKSAALLRLGGDEELLRELCTVFLEECPKWMSELGAAVGARDATRLKRVAHTLKGAVASCGGAAAFDVALVLETMGREGKVEGTEPLLERLKVEIARLVPAITSFAKGQEAGTDVAEG